MPRLIDANEILKSEHQHYDYMADEYYVLVRDIENAPTVSAKPVVRCKDCVNATRDKYGIVCTYHDRDVGEDDYCSWGERKEDGIR